MMNVALTDCRELLAGLSDYLDGEASEQLCAAIRKHVGDCEKCRVVVDTLRMTIKLYRELPKTALDQGRREELYRVLDLSGYLPRDPR
jgi:predicted anti-sigma-YlaC factor YlaD